MLVLFACKSANKNKEGVPLFDEIYLKLLPNEEVINVNTEIKNQYLTFFKYTNFQIPLFKYIKAKDYNIYIGIPYNTSLKRLSNIEMSEKPLKNIEFKTDNRTYFFKKQNKEGLFITQYSKLLNKNLVYILITSQSKEISDNVFNQINLSKRFN